MENHSASEALSGAFTASLAARYGVASNYRAVSHPSVPNYLALAAMEGDYVRPLTEIDPTVAGGIASALAGRRLPPVTSGFVGR